MVILGTNETPRLIGLVSVHNDLLRHCARHRKDQLIESLPPTLNVGKPSPQEQNDLYEIYEATVLAGSDQKPPQEAAVAPTIASTERTAQDGRNALCGDPSRQTIQEIKGPRKKRLWKSWIITKVRVATYSHELMSYIV